MSQELCSNGCCWRSARRVAASSVRQICREGFSPPRTVGRWQERTPVFKTACSRGERRHARRCHAPYIRQFFAETRKATYCPPKFLFTFIIERNMFWRRAYGRDWWLCMPLREIIISQMNATYVGAGLTHACHIGICHSMHEYTLHAAKQVW